MLLRPVVSVLLRAGMTWREFAELAKSVFVAVATDEFGIRSRPTNVSRVSILTGISRKEVKRQRELLLDDEGVASSKSNDATRILSAWFQDPDYLDDDGKPVVLPVDGAAPSFATLFSHYGGDTSQHAILKELISAESAEQLDGGRIAVKRRYHMPGNVDVGNLQFFGSNLFDHAATLNNNLSTDGRPKRLEGFAVDTQVDPSAVSEFRRFVDVRGQQFLEEIDDWLCAHRVDPKDSKTSPIRLGLGIYAVEGPLPEGKKL